MNSFAQMLEKSGEIGFVTEIVGGIIYAEGLPGAKPNEIVVFETGKMGQILALNQDSVEILTFSEEPIKVGIKVTRTNATFMLPVSEELLGTVVDPLGNSLSDGKAAKKDNQLQAVDTEPKGIMARSGVKKYLETGTSIVDLMVPLGKGQRELIIGDRKTGKTNFLLNTILTQAKLGNICILATIGKRKIDIKKAEEFFKENKIMDKVLIIASDSTDPAGVIFTTPYSAMAAAEYFRDQGKDVLLVLDDMSTHAKFYREISLLGKRFPGRNSYPGDIFYVHAKLLERAGNFKTKDTETAITCLPVVETTQSDLSGYIQTNLMSMTDGHLFFDGNLFSQGRRPALNPFLSVTRVGRQTQSELKRSINRELTSFLTLYEKIQNFIHFGSELNDSVKATLDIGKKITNLFDQKLNEFIPINIQIIIFTLLWGNLLDNLTIEQIIEKRGKLIELYLKDQKFAKEFDDFVEKPTSLNELLAAVKTGSPLLEKILKL
jgi:F-type H+-transporting ATPase subunit alpha